MITLTAKMRIKGENPSPFKIGESKIGGWYFLGETIDAELEFNRRNLISLDGEVRDRDNIQRPSFGIFSNAGSLSFKDTTSRFLGYANEGILTEGIEVSLFLNNTLSKKTKQVGSYYTSNWHYDNDNKSVEVSLKSDLEEWQDINIDGIDYDPRNPISRTMEWYYRWLHAKTPTKYNMMPFESLDAETKRVLSGTTVRYPLMESGNLWRQWVKICECCALYIYKNEIGKTVCKYSKGS